MIEAGLFLSDEERHNTESRIMHDAWLITHGAAINEFGRLVVTGNQYDEMKEAAEYPVGCKEWLDTDVDAAYKRVHGGQISSQDTRAVNELKRNGLYTIRSILAVGVFNAVPGEGARGRVEPMLSNPYGIELQELDPSPEYIANICDSLTEVPGIRVHRRVLAGLSVSDVLDAAAEGIDDVQAIADYSLKWSRNMREFNDEDKLRIAEGIVSSANEFAAAFTEAKELQRV